MVWDRCPSILKNVGGYRPEKVVKIIPTGIRIRSHSYRVPFQLYNANVNRRLVGKSKNRLGDAVDKNGNEIL